MFNLFSSVYEQIPTILLKLNNLWTFERFSHDHSWNILSFLCVILCFFKNKLPKEDFKISVLYFFLLFMSVCLSIYIYIYMWMTIEIYTPLPRRVEFSGEEVIVLPLAFIASLFIDELRSRQPFERMYVNNSNCDS